jgi:hypothetical protein
MLCLARVVVRFELQLFHLRLIARELSYPPDPGYLPTYLTMTMTLCCSCGYEAWSKCATIHSQLSNASDAFEIVYGWLFLLVLPLPPPPVAIAGEGLPVVQDTASGRT